MAGRTAAGGYEFKRRMLTDEDYAKIRQCVLTHLCRKSGAASFEELERESFDRLGFAAAVAEEEPWIYTLLAEVVNNVCLGAVRRARTCDGLPLSDPEDVLQTIQEKVFKQVTFFLCRRENASVGSLIGWIQAIGQNAIADEVQRSNRRIIRSAPEEQAQNIAAQEGMSENELAAEREELHRAALLGLAFLLRLRQEPYITMSTTLSVVVYPRRHAWEEEQKRIAGLTPDEPPARKGRAARASGYPREVEERYGNERLYQMRQGFFREVDEMLERMLNCSLDEKTLDVIDERLDRQTGGGRALGESTLLEAGGTSDNISRWKSVVGKRMQEAKKQLGVSHKF